MLLSKVAIPYLKISPNSLVYYNRYECGSFVNKKSSQISEQLKLWNLNFSSDQFSENKIELPLPAEAVSRIKSLSNLKDNEVKGDLSVKGSKAIKTAINWLEHLSKKQKVFCKELGRDIPFKLNFITLTLPSNQIQGYCDNYGNYTECSNVSRFVSEVNINNGVFDFIYSDNYVKKEFLNHFLVLLRRECKVHNYVWRAESQKNGNIHFHLTTNKYIQWQKLRELWNRVLAKSDLISNYQNQFKNMSFEEYCEYRGKHIPIENLKKAYDYGVSTNWLQPNTTDVHAVYKIKNMAAYLCEYMAKNNENYRKIEGSLWRSSMLLSKLKAATVLVSGRIADELARFTECYQERIKHMEWCSIFKFSINDLKFMLNKSAIVKEFISYRDSIFRSYLAKVNTSARSINEYITGSISIDVNSPKLLSV